MKKLICCILISKVTFIQKNNSKEVFCFDFNLFDNCIMNGFETSTKIRENGFPGIIVACSANSTPDIIQEYINAGINDYFAKPFKKQQLQTMLEKWHNLPQIGTNGLWKGPQ